VTNASLLFPLRQSEGKEFQSGPRGGIWGGETKNFEKKKIPKTVFMGPIEASYNTTMKRVEVQGDVPERYGVSEDSERLKRETRG